MSVAVLLRIGIVVTGLLIMWQSFYMHAVKKLAINLAVAWEGIGIGLILVGAIPVLSAVLSGGRRNCGGYVSCWSSGCMEWI